MTNSEYEHGASEPEAEPAERIEYDRWRVSERYLRDLYGDEVADMYVELREEERRSGVAASAGKTALAGSDA